MKIIYTERKQIYHFFLVLGSAAHIAGVQLNTIPNEPDGTFCLNQFKRKIRGDDCHEPITALAAIENTHNMCGGKVCKYYLEQFFFFYLRFCIGFPFL